MPEEKERTAPSTHTPDEVALEMMKFIAVTTGYGKGSSGPGFGAKQQARTPEEYAESLLELFERCRTVVRGKASA
jgi:hypothetical protein